LASKKVGDLLYVKCNGDFMSLKDKFKSTTKKVRINGI